MIFDEVFKKSAAKFLDVGSGKIWWDLITDWDGVEQEFDSRGTSIAINRRDPLDDGDQRPFRNTNDAQLYREMWSIGGDNDTVLSRGTLPHFIQLCFCGLLEQVREELKQATPSDLKILLETRHCMVRQSAIFFPLLGLAKLPIEGQHHSRLKCFNCFLIMVQIQ